jgi:peptide deformylase
MELQKKGAAVLSQIAIEVNHGEDVSDLIKSMRNVLSRENGAGLAANQVGSLCRVVLINTSDFVGTVINPVITKKSDNIVNSKEGCLSFPKKIANVRRSKMVVLEGFDENWNPIKKKLRGFSAFCAQHEIDHLNGITILPNQGDSK